MNARRRSTNPNLPGRVYPSDGAYYWWPKGGKWIRLCKISEGETQMLSRLAEEKRKADASRGLGDTPVYVDKYVAAERDAHREAAWPVYGEYVKVAFADVNVAQIDTAYVEQFLTEKWPGKLAMQRVMRSFMSGFCRWCIRNRLMTDNPCLHIKLKKPKPRKAYISDEQFVAIREAMLIDKTGSRVPAGPMMQCFVDLCYLTVQRTTDIRMLRWSQVDEAAGVIHFVPSKTEDSSGATVDWPITPEIHAVLERARELGKRPGGKVSRIQEARTDRTVIQTLTGAVYGATGVRSAWDRACERAGIAGFTLRDIRAKALTDAKRAGYDIAALMVAGAHTDAKTTEIYIKQRETPLSQVHLRIPNTG